MSIDNYTVFDVETANSSRASICSIGIVKVENNKIVFENEYLINPETNFSRINISFHHITPESVKDCPTFPEIWDKIKKYFIDTILIAHNAKVMDLCALYKTLDRYNIPLFDINYICTYELSKKFFKYYEVPSYGLESICEKIGITLTNHHNALDDALACNNIFEYFKKNYSEYIFEQKYAPKWINHKKINKDNIQFFKNKILINEDINQESYSLQESNDLANQYSEIKKSFDRLMSLFSDDKFSSLEKEKLFNIIYLFINPSFKSKQLENTVYDFLKINKITLDERFEISLNFVNYLCITNTISEHGARKIKKIIHYYIWDYIELFK